VHPDIEVTLGSVQRVEITLPIGAQVQRIEVLGGSSILGTTETQAHGISPETLRQLPLLMDSGPRAAAGFVTLMPGVSTGGGSNPLDARVNGSLQYGDEAAVDGVSMQQGFMSQGGMISIFLDFPMSPDMVSEVKILTSNYAPEYGSSTGGQIMAVTKSGGSSFHGAVFEFHRDDSLKAKQWAAGEKPEFNRNNFGANVGGPAKLPGLWSDRVKSYFYVDIERYRQTGGSNALTLSIPSLKERNGDFTDWRDADGNVIPIYDPATIRPDGHGGFIKDQFMGCDGRTPNVICPSRISQIVQPGWRRCRRRPATARSITMSRRRFPTRFSATPITTWGGTIYSSGTRTTSSRAFGTSARRKVRLTAAASHRQRRFFGSSELVGQPSELRPNFSGTLLNHMSMGYLNRNEGYGSVNQSFVDDFPKIAGVAGHPAPPVMIFSDGFEQFGNSFGINTDSTTTRPTFIINDAVTWTKSAHTLKIGMEYRSIMGNIHNNTNQAGTFEFGRGSTALVGVNSGSPIASFLLGAVDNGQAAFRAVSTSYPRQHAWIVHAGDTWRMNDRLTLDYGVRWDYYSPSSEKFDRFSFFDPVGANPGAAGRPGRLAFAGNGYAESSFGARYPEKNWYGGLAPRLGGVYSLSNKTVLRAGWGIFYTQAYYPGWGGGMNQDGFANIPAFTTSLGGIRPAFFLDEGFPQNFVRPPDIRSDYKNGQGILYRPADANRRPYSHQWNVSIDRELARNLAVSLAYVGSAGRRLPSTIDPLNAIDLRYLSLGDALNDEFVAGEESLHGVPLPYPGWVEQMTGCAPSVAQALRPYPQYCDDLQGLNENHGESMYTSLQMKLEKRFSSGVYALVSYTLSKTITSASDNTQPDTGTWSGLQGVISPFERERNRTIAATDTPQVLSAAFIYELPFGEGKKSPHDNGVVNAILSGWQVSTIFRYSSGLPTYFRSGFCNVPGPFRTGCIPAVTKADSVFAQNKGSFDPAAGPLFNADAFEPTSVFNFYQGHGNRLEASVRGFGFKNQDLSLIKNTRLPGGTNVEVRIEAFNVWNWHNFPNSGFNNDIASPEFGTWNGSVSESRTVQLAARFEF
jgi:hypothetical protein